MKICSTCGGATERPRSGKCRRCYDRSRYVPKTRPPRATTCSTCGAPSDRLRLGLCGRCYRASRRTPRPRAPRPRATGPCATCGTMDSPRYRTGLCISCYEKARRARHRRECAKHPRDPCIREGCDALTNKHPLTGLCDRHYAENRRRRRGIPPRARKPELCGEPGCGRPNYARERCAMHYHRWRKMLRTGYAPVRSTAPKLPEKVARGIWTDDGETVTLCWPPADAGPDWKCTCGRTREEAA